MKYILISLLLFSMMTSTLEYTKHFENDAVIAAYVKLLPQEETGMHYDALPAIVVALRGGVITRFEAE